MTYIDRGREGEGIDPQIGERKSSKAAKDETDQFTITLHQYQHHLVCNKMVNNVMETEEARSLDQQQNGSQVSAVVIVEKSSTTVSTEINEPGEDDASSVYACTDVSVETSEVYCSSTTSSRPVDGRRENDTPRTESDSNNDDSNDVFEMPVVSINGSDQMRIDDLIGQGISPVDIIRAICPNISLPLETFSPTVIFSILHDLIDRNPVREKLATHNTFEDAIELFRRSKKIIVLTGAGVSVSCGIPDFRSKNGIYARLHVDFPDLPDPMSMFDIDYFTKNPVPFYDFAREIFPGQFEPSVSHKFIKALEDNGQLLRNFTQNIDTLEKQTGIQRVVECHGSFSKATCQKCNAKFDGDIIKEDVMAKRVAKCPACVEGVIKPDIVFFGEDLGPTFHNQMSADKNEADLLVVIGSSLKVRPVSLIPYSVRPDIPQILINREPLSNYKHPDIQLLGDCDVIIRDL
ncbi:hypothetical protein WR25_24749 [Diploscapter pachys]|uniref:NAD-dependent protein deacetylase sir-2.1 n=1 Tax=Diploscapter pachys TaxID=2018661 RepID=A0A2A2KQ18_9BILA|nr:hypothetical protein WR25_24749 [Diploscapter pachys]